jgi:hypothetical protein
MATRPIPDSEDHRELVKIFDTQEETEALVIKGLLESAGIESLISSRVGPQDVFPGVGGVILSVPAESAEEARKLIEDYRTGNEAEVIEQDGSDEADDGGTSA